MQKPKRTRLSPEDRRSHLLDCTQELILKNGLNSFTIETLAISAGVSTPLVYKYFDTRLQLLQSLLLREYQQFHQRLYAEFDASTDFFHVVKMMVKINFEQICHGDVVPILARQSDVAVILRPLLPGNNKKLSVMLVGSLISKYPMDRKLAVRATKMASGTSLAAAEQFAEFGGDRETMINEASQFIIAGIESFTKR